ncbi:MAG: 16S rRNA processing protein RimM [Alphaproteobacteria bacterium]|nr:16S rRNA processing protein RimM [Alphaproteobacteria bacterium]
MRARSSRARDDELSFGQIIGVFGVHGEVRLFLHNRESELFHQGGSVTLVSPEGERREARLSTRPGAGGRVLGRIEGVDTPEAASALQDWELVIAKDALPDLEENEFYHADLLGLEVRTDAGQALGRIRRIWSTGPVDVWEAAGTGGVSWIPALAENLVEVDLDAGILIVRDGCASTS